jgi:hypothetical protein
MTTLAFWSCSDDHVGFLVLQPTWSSLQNQTANVVINAGLESYRGHHCRTRNSTWSSLQNLTTNVIITAVMTTLAFWSCSDDHAGFLAL